MTSPAKPAWLAVPCLHVLACADPCVDDGLLQKNCPQDSATDSGSDSASASATLTATASATASATDSGGVSAGTDTATSGTDSAGSSTETDGGTEGDTEGSDGPGIEDFEPGALVLPMDTDYQDMGMLEAYGLTYALLSAKVPVAWVIEPGKPLGGVDFTTSAEDLQTAATVVDHGYRGGPFVVRVIDAALALPIVEAWQLDHPNTVVHRTTAPFQAWVARRLRSAPTIAIFADGNEAIARGYLQAAGIPDSTGDVTWPASSPDMLDVAEVSGPTASNHRDGALFDGDGDPLYCQFMSMHWAVKDAESNPEVVAEVREFLRHTTHFFAECQAVNAFENLDPHGHFITPNGFQIAAQPKSYTFSRHDSPFAQFDGTFASVGGSEPAYTLPTGDAYKQPGTVIITEAGSPEGIADVWMTGFLDGKCAPDDHYCPGAGKVSYLGGHAYSIAVPISQHPETQGARLFLNSLFEAPCALTKG